MRFIANSPSAARPSRQGAGCANVHLSCHCADLALLYGKGGALSPFRRVSWAFLAGPCLSRSGLGLFGGPKVRPPRFGQGLGLGLAPGGDPGVVAGGEDFRDRKSLE